MIPNNSGTELEMASKNIDLMRNYGKRVARLEKDFSEKDASVFFSPQANSDGKKLVACGDVSGLMHYGPYYDTVNIITNGGGYYWSTAFVHSSHKADKYYQASIWYENGGYFGGNCVCLAEENSRYCKHVAALVWSLYALKHHRADVKAPKIFMRPGIKKFANACDEVKVQVDYNKSWGDFVVGIEKAPAKKRSYASSYSKFVTESEVKQKRLETKTKAAAKQAKADAKNAEMKPAEAKKSESKKSESKKSESKKSESKKSGSKKNEAKDSEQKPDKQRKRNRDATSKTSPVQDAPDAAPSTKKQKIESSPTAELRKSTRTPVPKRVKDYTDL
jgi:hypothetical protein